MIGFRCDCGTMGTHIDRCIDEVDEVENETSGMHFMQFGSQRTALFRRLSSFEADSSARRGRFGGGIDRFGGPNR